MLDEFDFDFYEGLYEKFNNKQCHICGGWALFCECENEFSIEDKEGVTKFLRIINKK